MYYSENVRCEMLSFTGKLSGLVYLNLRAQNGSAFFFSSTSVALWKDLFVSTQLEKSRLNCCLFMQPD